MEYYYEDLARVMRLGYRVENVIYEDKTESGQSVLIFDSEAFGRTLVIDGIVQSSEATEFIYNEMMTHMALDCQEAPKKALIIGGGSGLTARQALKYPCVEQITVCEISEDIVNICKEHLPQSAAPLGDERVSLVIENGSTFLDAHKNEFDAVLVDGCDPIGAAEALYSERFYEKCIDALTDSGVLCVQTGSPLFEGGRVEYDKLTGYLTARSDVWYKPVIFTCPMIIGGFYMFALVARHCLAWERSLHISDKDVGYYDPRNRGGYFKIPNFIKRRLGE